MTKYKYQLHMHTLPCSACSKIYPKELAYALKEGGYQGGVITNHFKGGNTGINRKLPWEEFVKAYENDYLEVKKWGEELDLDIFFGIEQGVGGGKEILAYGMTPQILYSNPCLSSGDPKIWYDTLKSLGALIYQAHPFREASHITQIGVLEGIIDGIEIFNATNPLKNNMEAEEYWENNKALLLSSGGDVHTAQGACCGGIETAVRLKTEKDLVEILRTGRFNLIRE